MIHLPGPTCKLIGTLALLGTGVCAKKAYNIVSQLSREENSNVPRESKIQRKVTSLLGETQSRSSRVSREVFEALTWAVPMMGFIAVACAALEPDGKYIPSELAARLTQCSCKTPTYPDGSENPHYTISRSIHQTAAQYFPDIVHAPAPHWGEGRFYYLYYYSSTVVNTVHRLITGLFPYVAMGLVGWGIRNQGKAQAASPFPSRPGSPVSREMTPDRTSNAELSAKVDGISRQLAALASTLQVGQQAPFGGVPPGGFAVGPGGLYTPSSEPERGEAQDASRSDVRTPSPRSSTASAVEGRLLKKPHSAPPALGGTSRSRSFLSRGQGGEDSPSQELGSSSAFTSPRTATSTLTDNGGGGSS